MNDLELAALKRKHAATQELAKRNELANLLRAAGHDPDAVETAPVAPEGRTAPKLHTTTPTKPVAKASTTSKKRGPGRPKKTENITGEGGLTLPSIVAEKDE